MSKATRVGKDMGENRAGLRTRPDVWYVPVIQGLGNGSPGTSSRWGTVPTASGRISRGIMYGGNKQAVI